MKKGPDQGTLNLSASLFGALFGITCAVFVNLGTFTWPLGLAIAVMLSFTLGWAWSYIFPMTAGAIIAFAGYFYVADLLFH